MGAERVVAYYLHAIFRHIFTCFINFTSRARAANGFDGMQHNRGDHQSFTAGFAGIQHNRGDHQSFTAGFAGIQHNRGDLQSFAVVLPYVFLKKWGSKIVGFH